MSVSPGSDSIDIDRYAEVLAHLRHFPADKHAEVIARLGIRRCDWDAAATKWRGVRDAERRSGKLDVTVRFGRVMANTRERLEAQQPTIESLGSLPGPDGAPPELAAPVDRKAVPGTLAGGAISVAAPVVQVPSYVVAESRATLGLLAPPEVPAAEVRRLPPELTSTTLGAAPSAAPAIPFAAPGASAAETLQRMLQAGDVHRPAEPRQAAVGSGTLAAPDDAAGPPRPPDVADLTLEQYASLRVELEMWPDHAPAILSRYQVAPAGRPGLDAYWRARFSAAPPQRMMFARTYAQFLAWFRANPTQGTLAQVSSPAPLAPMRRVPGHLASTLPIDSAPLASAVMPFVAPALSEDPLPQTGGEMRAAPWPSTGAPGVDEARRALDLRGAGRAASTLTGTVDAVETPTQAALPFAEARPLMQRTPVMAASLPASSSSPVGAMTSEPLLTLQQYASLCVDLEADPEHAGEVLTRYHLDQEQKATVDAYYRRLFAERATTYLTFDSAQRTYRAWLRERKRTGG